MMLSCSKSNNNSNAGIVLHGSPNYSDSLTINTSTYTIFYLGGIYTYTPSSVPTASFLSLVINYNGASVANATLSNSTYTTLQMSGTNAVFQSGVYIGK